MDRETALSVYKTCILPTLEYCSFILDSATVKDQQQLQVLQNRGLRECLKIRNPLDISEDDLHKECNIAKLSKRRDTQLLCFVHKLSKNPNYTVDNALARTRGDRKVKLKVARLGSWTQTSNV